MSVVVVLSHALMNGALLHHVGRRMCSRSRRSWVIKALSVVILPMANDSHQKRDRGDLTEGDLALIMGKVEHPSINSILEGAVTTACNLFFTG